MSEKVNLTKEQSEAIETLKQKFSEVDIIKIRLGVVGMHPNMEEVKNLQNMLTDKLIRALYIGYEVEKTPEEKVREYYEELSNKKFDSNTYFHKMEAVQKTLDLLGIKIFGVNDV